MSPRKRKSTSSSEGKLVESYEDALEAGYIGGPVDEADHTVAGVVAAADTTEPAEPAPEASE